MDKNTKEYQIINWLGDKQFADILLLVSPVQITGDDWRFDLYGYSKLFRAVIASTHGTYRTSITHTNLAIKPGEPRFWYCGQGNPVYQNDTREKSFKRALDLFLRKFYTYDLWHKGKFCSHTDLFKVISLISVYPDNSLDSLMHMAGAYKNQQN